MEQRNEQAISLLQQNLTTIQKVEGWTTAPLTGTLVLPGISPIVSTAVASSAIWMPKVIDSFTKKKT